MILLRLLLLAGLLGLARQHDPYAPFGAVRPAAFPRERLTRAGLDEATVDRLEDEYDALDPAARAEFDRYVSGHADDAIRDRYAEGVPPEEPVEPVEEPAATPTYEELNGLTVDELEDLLREWNDTHPEQHLAIAGRKGEKIGRLLDAYEGERDAATQAPTATTPEATPIAEQQLPTAPTATTPEGTPAAFTPPPGTVETGGASTGAQEPAQTAGAAPGAGTATTEE